MFCKEVDADTLAALRHVAGGDADLLERARQLFNKCWLRSLAVVRKAYEQRDVTSAWSRAISAGEEVGIPAVFFDTLVESEG